MTSRKSKHKAQLRAGEAQRMSRSLESFVREYHGIMLRPYQLEAAQAVLDSVKERAGRSIVVMFARQSGKDELCANLKVYLLARASRTEAGIVEVNPTYKPQTINAMQRFEDRLQRNRLLGDKWSKRSDFIRKVGGARVTFLSGDAKANVVGAVASLLLIVNEAQDIEPAVYDRNFAPMAASTNATRLFMGTAWTSHTLLSRELRAARQAEQADGIRRVFTFDAEDVRRVVPAYGEYVDGQIARLGRGHPLIRTQYFNEEIDAQGGMFTPARRAMMRCDAASTGTEMERGLGCVFTLDVAGQDEARFHKPDEQMLRNPGRDSVTLTVTQVDLSEMDTLQAPIFRIIERHQWTGRNHLHVFGALSALADRWRPQYIIIDATGVGEGLWSMLDKRYPTRVVPVKFSAQKKSELGYRYLAMIETGRVRDCAQGGFTAVGWGAGGVSQADVDRQYAACVSEVLLGPQKTMRWGVPEGTRDENGGLVHDDIVMADALLGEADALEWLAAGPAIIVAPRDPLGERRGV